MGCDWRHGAGGSVVLYLRSLNEGLVPPALAQGTNAMNRHPGIAPRQPEFVSRPLRQQNADLSGATNAPELDSMLKKELSPKAKYQYSTISVIVLPELYDLIRKHAEREDRTISQVIRIACIRYFMEVEKEEAARREDDYRKTHLFRA